MRNTLNERDFDSFVESPTRAGKTALEVVVSSGGSSGGSSSEYVFDKYNLNNLEDAIPLYAGFADSTGKYLIKRFNESTGSMDYANISNNPSVTTYDDAWTNKLTLNFNKINELTGV